MTIKEWLKKKLDSNAYARSRWRDRDQGIFCIPWMKQDNREFEAEDAKIFEVSSHRRPWNKTGVYNPSTCSATPCTVYQVIRGCTIRLTVFPVEIRLYPWWRHQMETFSVLLACVRGIQQSALDSPSKDQWCRALMFLFCVWTNGWANHRDAGDLRCHCAHYDVTVMHSVFSVEMFHNQLTKSISNLLNCKETFLHLTFDK